MNYIYTAIRARQDICINHLISQRPDRDKNRAATLLEISPVVNQTYYTRDLSVETAFYADK